MRVVSDTSPIWNLAAIERLGKKTSRAALLSDRHFLAEM